MLFGRLGVRARLIIGFGAVLAMCMLIGGLAIDSMAPVEGLQGARNVLVSLLAATVAGGALLAYAVTNSITRRLRDAADVAQRVATGDLCVEISVTTNDDTGRLLASLAAMRAALADAIGSIRQSAQAVGASSNEIARGNQDLSARTEQQAANLERTASSMEELAATVRQNAESAKQANQLAMGASEVALRGNEAVRGVADTMAGITDSSRKINDIIGVIDGIAFQTNILALNAAVEAARAGEQGRGFAVVASEVRSLAQRSAQAAKEITALIQDSVGRVEAGTKQVQGAGKTMDEIMGAVKRVTDIMGEIAAASAEQLSGIEQVSAAVSQMDQVVQQNAALVEQSAAAAENMASQADSLVSSVARFKLPGAQVIAPRPQAQKKPVESKPAEKKPAAPKPRAASKPAMPVSPAPALALAAAEGDWKEI